jgi:hypothetical protein
VLMRRSKQAAKEATRNGGRRSRKPTGLLALADEWSAAGAARNGSNESPLWWQQWLKENPKRRDAVRVNAREGRPGGGR